jgi:hypothetical protein
MAPAAAPLALAQPPRAAEAPCTIQSSWTTRLTARTVAAAGRPEQAHLRDVDLHRHARRAATQPCEQRPGAPPPSTPSRGTPAGRGIRAWLGVVVVAELVVGLREGAGDGWYDQDVPQAVREAARQTEVNTHTVYYNQMRARNLVAFYGCRRRLSKTCLFVPCAACSFYLAALQFFSQCMSVAALDDRSYTSAPKMHINTEAAHQYRSCTCSGRPASQSSRFVFSKVAFLIIPKWTLNRACSQSQGSLHTPPMHTHTERQPADVQCG